MYTWTKDLETGNAMIDTQHRQLIDAINKLLEACAQGKGRDNIRSTLAFMQDYTAKHFSDEEALQQKYRYPDALGHKKYHDSFKKVIGEIVAQYDKEGPTLVVVGKMNSSLGGWLINHIKREDVKVAAHIRSAGGK